VRNFCWALLASTALTATGCGETAAQRGTVSIPRDEPAAGSTTTTEGSAPPAGRTSSVIKP
jgi:hypothetical protein